MQLSMLAGFNREWTWAFFGEVTECLSLNPQERKRRTVEQKMCELPNNSLFEGAEGRLQKSKNLVATSRVDYATMR